MRTLVLLLVVLSSAVRADPTQVVADVQVMRRGPSQYVLELRSTGAQAFDAQGTRRRVSVALHGARLGPRPAVGRTPFGRVRLRAQRDGGVVFRLRLRRGWQADVRQGRSPSTVEVRVHRPTR